MKRYYSYLGLLALMLLGAACSKNSDTVTLEATQEQVEVSPPSTPLRFALSLTPDELEGEARSLSYTIDREAMTIKGSPLPEKPLNAIVAIGISDRISSVYAVGRATFSKVPGKNIFYCDDVRTNRGVSLSNDQFRLYYTKRGVISSWRESFYAKQVTARAIFTYQDIEARFHKGDSVYSFRPKINWLDYDSWRVMPMSKSQVLNHNLGMFYIMEDVKLEVKDGRVQVVEGEKPKIRPCGTILFLRLRNTTAHPMSLQSISSSDALFVDAPRLTYVGLDWGSYPEGAGSRDDVEIRKYLRGAHEVRYGMRDGLNLHHLEPLQPGEEATFMFWLVPSSKSERSKLKIVYKNARWSSPKLYEWTTPRPVYYGDIMRASIDLSE